ncbi:hypothetical protein [Propionivibrio dicarboxylicus]|uniref:PsiF repeat-containing protein n=1 Tax=Propionivibrio dicarboxylicus TaxID=83767 RepID=A0A1G8BWS8_9RHOO|nr:hypothetical protein [Propionivibrio dicarboxylicus]SDH37519.1 hypothetical protein SAMN05660652_01614 [Propionivibrio dicarboxylicus]
MKNALPVLASIAALLAVPAMAQQGPAGVPGAPLIGASIAPPPAPVKDSKPPQPRKRAGADCTKAKDVELCKARQEARRQARDACKPLTGAERRQCLDEKLPKGK